MVNELLDECRFMDAAMALVMSAALWGGALHSAQN
jgi:hypothetical protein